MAATEIPSPHGSLPSPLAGRIFLIAIGLSVALLGGLFVWLMGRSFLRAKEMRSWPQVPCIILTSETDQRKNDPDSPTEYRQLISFGYEWKGEAYTADHLGLRGSPWTSKQNLSEKRAAEFTVGMKTTCFVNPAEPTAAYLKPDSLAPGYSIWFPALFVVGGLGICISTMRSGKSLNSTSTRAIEPS